MENFNGWHDEQGIYDKTKDSPLVIHISEDLGCSPVVEYETTIEGCSQPFKFNNAFEDWQDQPNNEP